MFIRGGPTIPLPILLGTAGQAPFRPATAAVVYSSRIAASYFKRAVSTLQPDMHPRFRYGQIYISGSLMQKGSIFENLEYSKSSFNHTFHYICVMRLCCKKSTFLFKKISNALLFYINNFLVLEAGKILVQDEGAGIVRSPIPGGQSNFPALFQAKNTAHTGMSNVRIELVSKIMNFETHAARSYIQKLKILVSLKFS